MERGKMRMYEYLKNVEKENRVSGGDSVNNSYQCGKILQAMYSVDMRFQKNNFSTIKKHDKT